MISEIHYSPEDLAKLKQLVASAQSAAPAVPDQAAIPTELPVSDTNAAPATPVPPQEASAAQANPGAAAQANPASNEDATAQLQRIKDIRDSQQGYNQRAQGFQQAAAAIPQAQRMPQPQGTSQNIAASLRNAMENFGRFGAPGGYYGQEQTRIENLAQQNAARAAQAKELLTLGQGQQELALTAGKDLSTELKQQSDATERAKAVDVANQRAQAASDAEKRRETQLVPIHGEGPGAPLGTYDPVSHKFDIQGYNPQKPETPPSNPEDRYAKLGVKIANGTATQDEKVEYKELDKYHQQNVVTGFGLNNPQQNLSYLTRQTQSGKQYVEIPDRLSAAGVAQLTKQAGDAGIPSVTRDTADTLGDIDEARKNLDYMNKVIGPKLASDPQGRIYSAPANTIAKLAQTDPDLGAVGTYRTAAIQAMAAIAGRKGLRINKNLVDIAMQNDIPQITDTLPTAQARLKNLQVFLDSAETAHLRGAQPGAPDTSMPFVKPGGALEKLLQGGK